MILIECLLLLCKMLGKHIFCFVLFFKFNLINIALYLLYMYKMTIHRLELCFSGCSVIHTLHTDTYNAYTHVQAARGLRGR